jgi:uncharacterized protein YdhG (YjbR/CyaY superfamily)
MSKVKDNPEFEAYVRSQPEACRDALRDLRRIILEAVPIAGETFNYNIPAFQLTEGGKREQQIMIAGYAKHVGLYPHPTTMEHFEEHLSAYKRGKGSVQFPVHEPLPGKLIADMIRYRKSLLDASGT